MLRRASVVHVAPPVRWQLALRARQWAGSHRDVVRARIVLLAAAGLSNAETARQLGLTEKTVRKWRARFALNSTIAALEDLHRSGRPARVSLANRCEVIKLACSDPTAPYAPRTERGEKRKPPPFRDVWTQDALCVELGKQGIQLSRSEVGRILRAEGLRPHRVRLWLHSPDPDFQPKVKRICELYLHPPEGAYPLAAPPWR